MLEIGNKRSYSPEEWSSSSGELGGSAVGRRYSSGEWSGSTAGLRYSSEERDSSADGLSYSSVSGAVAQAGGAVARMSRAVAQVNGIVARKSGAIAQKNRAVAQKGLFGAMFVLPARLMALSTASIASSLPAIWPATVSVTARSGIVPLPVFIVGFTAL